MTKKPVKKKPIKNQPAPEHSIIYEQNHDLILTAYMAIIKEKKRLPKIKEIAEKCSLSPITVSNHLAEIQSEDIKKRYRHMAVLTDQVILGQFQAAVQGDHKAAELYLSIVEGYDKASNINLKVGRYKDMSDEELDLENQRLQKLLNESTPTA